MTQENILVSPLTSACPKPGVPTPAFRPAEPGDTRRDVAQLSKLRVSCLSTIWRTAHRHFTTAATPNPVNPVHPVKNSCAIGPTRPSSFSPSRPFPRNSRNGYSQNGRTRKFVTHHLPLIAYHSSSFHPRLSDAKRFFSLTPLNSQPSTKLK
jgi:hypothetical protein